MVSYMVLKFAYRDHEVRHAWLGSSFPLDLSTLPVRSDEVPLQYPSLSMFLHTPFLSDNLLTILQSWGTLLLPRR